MKKKIIVGNCRLPCAHGHFLRCRMGNQNLPTGARSQLAAGKEAIQCGIRIARGRRKMETCWTVSVKKTVAKFPFCNSLIHPIY